jgi:hypothetical protein
MMPEAARNPQRTCCETGCESSGFGPANLDAPPLSPYTSAVPEMDVILNPRGPRSSEQRRLRMAEDFRDVATL